MPVTKCQNRPSGTKCGQSPVRRVVTATGRPFYCHDCAAAESEYGDVRTVADRAATASAAAAESRTDRMVADMADRLAVAESVAAETFATAVELATARVSPDMLRDWQAAAVRRYGMTEPADHVAERSAESWPRRIATLAVRYVADATAAAESVAAGTSRRIPYRTECEDNGRHVFRPSDYSVADAVADAVARDGDGLAVAVRRQSPGAIPGMIRGGRVPWEEEDGTVRRDVLVAIDGTGSADRSAESAYVAAESVARRTDGTASAVLRLVYGTTSGRLAGRSPVRRGGDMRHVGWDLAADMAESVRSVADASLNRGRPRSVDGPAVPAVLRPWDGQTAADRAADMAGIAAAAVAECEAIVGPLSAVERRYVAETSPDMVTYRDWPVMGS